MSKNIRSKEDAEAVDKENGSFLAEHREIVKRIEAKKAYWASKFRENNLRFIETLNGFVIDIRDHQTAMRLIRSENPPSAETAALFFNYADLTEFKDADE